MTEPTRIVMVHPADVNLAEAKARAAEYGATVVSSPHVPRGRMFILDPAALAPFRLCMQPIITPIEGTRFGLRATGCTRPHDHEGDHFADGSDDEQ